MSTAEIKNSLHHLIDGMDENTLLAAFGVMNDIKENSHIYNDKLSAAELAAVEEGRKAIREGRFVTLEEFLKNRPRWNTM